MTRQLLYDKKYVKCDQCKGTGFDTCSGSGSPLREVVEGKKFVGHCFTCPKCGGCGFTPIYREAYS